MGALEIVIMVIVDIIAIVLIGVVLLQPSERTGIGAVAGGAEQFLGKSKAKGFEEKLKLLTKICAAVFLVLLTVLLIVT